MTEHILLVDDEPDLEVLVSQKFRRQVKDKKYALHFAYNGAEALQVLEENPEISVIVTSISMPIMNGLELLSRINETNSPTKKVIVISAYGDIATIRTAMNGGAFDFLTKPIDLNDLEKTIVKALGIINVIKDGTDSHNKLNELNKDLSAAKEIQQSILPKVFPPFPNIKNLDIYGRMEPAKQVGGDFFDFFSIDEDNIAFVIGDVSGKGAPAAIFMAVVRTLIRSYAKNYKSTAECIKKVNDILYNDAHESMFVTLFYGIINLATGEVRYTNAGHNKPYIIKKNSIVIQIEDSDTIVAAFDTAEFNEHKIQLEKESSILLYTDGVVEAKNPAKQLLQNENLLCYIKNNIHSLTPKALVNGIFQYVNEYSTGVEQSDDITVLSLLYL